MTNLNFNATYHYKKEPTRVSLSVNPEGAINWLRHIYATDPVWAIWAACQCFDGITLKEIREMFES